MRKQVLFAAVALAASMTLAGCANNNTAPAEDLTAISTSSSSDFEDTEIYEVGELTEYVSEDGYAIEYNADYFEVSQMADVAGVDLTYTGKSSDSTYVSFYIAKEKTVDEALKEAQKAYSNTSKIEDCKYGEFKGKVFYVPSKEGPSEEEDQRYVSIAALDCKDAVLMVETSYMYDEDVAGELLISGQIEDVVNSLVVAEAIAEEAEAVAEDVETLKALTEDEE